MKIYTTLNNEKYDLDNLSVLHKKFIIKIFIYYKKRPEWNKFANHWLKEGLKVWKNTNKKLVVNLPIFRVCQDLESRLGIREGYIKEPDYRDELLKIIEEYPSRYKFCKKVGIDEAFLSNILRKKKNISMTKLQDLIHKIGYVVAFVKRENVAGRYFPRHRAIEK